MENSAFHSRFNFSLLVLLVMVLAGYPTHASGDALFDATVTAMGSTVRQEFDKAGDLIDFIDKTNIQVLFPGYNDTQIVNSTMNFRGLPILMSFPTAGSTTLRLQVPATGLDITFTGATRSASIDLLKDWFKKSGSREVTKIQQALVKLTATDPIAGNPTSMTAQMVSNSFDRGFMNKATFVEKAPSTAQSYSNLIGIYPRYSRFTSDGKSIDNYALPLSYTFRSDGDSRRQFEISLPLQYTRTEKAESYGGALGVSYSQPLTDRTSRHQWIITPSVDYSLAGSVDMYSLGQVIQGAVSSSYTYLFDSNYALSLGNMVGYYQTLKFKYGDYKFDPQINNYFFRNGLMLAIPTPAVKQGTVLELFAIDTRYTGDSLCVDNYQEFGFAFGFIKRKVVADQPSAKDKQLGETVKEKVKEKMMSLRVGMSYVYSNKSKGFTANMGFTF
jgi:hypothetical protein